MNKLINSLVQSARDFAKDDEGAQVVEYALIIAVVSIGLVLALGGPTPSLSDGFTAFITRVTDCLTDGVCT